ncbi:hypothetical protein EZV73_18675 [Acidaminobacter sp. JC074]|uniref:hypothetical protein n=1 Tax=Acidaminobacter sp. JC074 TaxID=2530199 RepID=UPI001F10FBF3|nr:hypothetical protein [Acidaminobacter sp. JC074]MCH4889614.1 hypothetical protein [Acidaminobacter sp. JC074]
MDYVIIFLIALVGVFKHLLMLLLSLHLCDGKINKNRFSILVWAVLLSVIETVVLEATMGEKIYLIQLMGYLLYGFVVYTYGRKTFYYGLSMTFVVRTLKLPISILSASIAGYYSLTSHLGMLLATLLTVLFMYILYDLLQKGKLSGIQSFIVKFNRTIYMYICAFYISIGVVIPYIVTLIVERRLGYLYFGTVFNFAILGMLLVFIIVYIGAQRSYVNKSNTLRAYLEKHGEFLEAYDHYSKLVIPSHLMDELNKINQVYLKTIFFRKIGESVDKKEDLSIKLIDCDSLSSRQDVLIEYIDYVLNTASGNQSIELVHKDSYQLIVKSDQINSRDLNLPRSNEIGYELIKASDGLTQIVTFV